MGYRHTQRGPVHLILYGIGGFQLVSAWFAWSTIPLAIGVVFIVLARCFTTMTVRDAGMHLMIEYGPWTVFKKRIAYRDIEAVERGRSSWIDGGGIHYVPGRGWTYNLWGFDCAVLTVAGQTVRVGSDDADNLVSFLSGRVGG